MKFARTLGLACPLLVPALTLVGCGGSPPPPPAPVVAPPKAAPPPDTTAVAEPQTLLLFARLAHPSASLKTIAGWSGLPLSFDREIAGTLVGKHAGSVVDLQQPIDFAAASDPAGRAMKPYFAYSIAVTSAEEAKRVLAKDYDAAPGANGVVRLDPKRSKNDDDDPGADEDERRCELAPSAGSAPMRFICGSNDAALELLAPYLARTTPRSSFPADLHVEARLDPLKPMIKNSRAMVPVMVRGLLGQQKMNEPAMAEIINGILGDTIDFTLDLARVNIDADIADSGAKATLAASFNDQQSLVARLATSHPERADVPPAAFWHLPADADVAIFNRGRDVKDLDHAKQLLLDAFHKGIENAGGNAADQHALDDAVAHALELAGSPGVFAKGLDATQAAKAIADAKGKKGLDRAALAQASGYGIVGLDAPAANVQAVFKEWATLVARPGIVKWMKQTAGNGAPATTLKSVPVPAKLGLPKGTLAFDLTTVHALPADASAPPAPATKPRAGDSSKPGAKPAKPAAKPAAPKVELDKPVTLRIFVVPDGARTWIGYALDSDLAAARVKAALEGAPEDKTLAKRAGLDDLRAAKAGSGGFLDVRGVVQKGALGVVFNGAPSSLDPDVGPAEGSPILVTMTARGETGSTARSLVDTVTVPRAAITEIVQFGMKAMQNGGSF